jgi:hypothetical protein
LIPPCLLLPRVAKRFQSLRRNPSNNHNVSNVLNSAHNSVVTTEATNDRNNAVETDSPSTMQSGSELLNTICPKVL